MMPPNPGQLNLAEMEDMKLDLSSLAQVNNDK